jgi:hypothetical protein
MEKYKKILNNRMEAEFEISFLSMFIQMRCVSFLPNLHQLLQFIIIIITIIIITLYLPFP